MSKLRKKISLINPERTPLKPPPKHIFKMTPSLKTNTSFKGALVPKCTPQMLKERLYHKHLSRYNESSGLNNTTLLPFLISLRTPDEPCRMPLNSPFVGGAKQTISNQTRKQVSDMSASVFRISKAYYRWHNQSGANTKFGCDFECSLRESDKESDNFTNVLRPIQHSIEKVVYSAKSLVCARQKRLFTIQ